MAPTPPIVRRTTGSDPRINLVHLTLFIPMTKGFSFNGFSSVSIRTFLSHRGSPSGEGGLTSKPKNLVRELTHKIQSPTSIDMGCERRSGPELTQRGTRIGLRETEGPLWPRSSPPARRRQGPSRPRRFPSAPRGESKRWGLGVEHHPSRLPRPFFHSNKGGIWW